jgi:hypothetical protein
LNALSPFICYSSFSATNLGVPGLIFTAKAAKLQLLYVLLLKNQEQNMKGVLSLNTIENSIVILSLPKESALSAVEG